MRPASLANYSTRCLISHRPEFMTKEPLFYQCPSCGELIISNSTTKAPEGDGHRPHISCCGNTLAPLELCTDEAVIKEHPLSFVIFGGYERNSVRIEVEGGFHPMEDDHNIRWFYIRTFQGGQLKLLSKSSRSYVNFSFADNDAFVYCDREICRMGREHCQFLCKRGMVVYAYCTKHGLFRMELDGN